MGFNVKLQDEFSGQLDAIGDRKNILDRLFPEPGGNHYPMLGSIDPYADAIFNGLQMNRFLAELADIIPKAQTQEEQELISKIESMAKRARDETHIYLKFVGD